MATQLEDLLSKIEKYVEGIFRMRVSSHRDGTNSHPANPTATSGNTSESANESVKEVFIVRPEDVLDASSNRPLRSINESDSRELVVVPPSINKSLVEFEDWKKSELDYLKDMVYMQNRMYTLVSQIGSDLEVHKANLKYAEEGIVDAIKESGKNKAEPSKKKDSLFSKLLGWLGGGLKGLGGFLGKGLMAVPEIAAFAGLLKNGLSLFGKAGKWLLAPLLGAGKFLGVKAAEIGKSIGTWAWRSVATSRGGMAVGRAKDAAVNVAATAGGFVKDTGAKVKTAIGKGASRVGGGIASGAIKLGKALKPFTKIPVLGTALALGTVASDVAAAEGIEDPTERRNAKGSSIGGGVGSVAGMALGSIFGPLGAIAGGFIGEQLGSTLGGAIADIVPDIEKHFGKIKGYVTDTFALGPIEGFKKIAKDVWNTDAVKSVRDIASSVWDSAPVQFLRDQWEKMLPVFDLLGRMFKDIFNTDIVQTFKDAMSDLWNLDALTAFQNLMDRIFGVDIGEALQDTLGEAWDNLTDWIMSVIAKIPGAKSILGIKTKEEQIKEAKKNVATSTERLASLKEEHAKIKARIDSGEDTSNEALNESLDIQNEIADLEKSLAKNKRIAETGKTQKELDHGDRERRRAERAKKANEQIQKRSSEAQSKKAEALKKKEEAEKNDLNAKIKEMNRLASKDPEKARKIFDEIKEDAKKYGIEIHEPIATQGTGVESTPKPETAESKPQAIDNVDSSIVKNQQTTASGRLQQSQAIENVESAKKNAVNTAVAEQMTRNNRPQNITANSDNSTTNINYNTEISKDRLSADNRSISNSSQWGAPEW